MDATQLEKFDNQLRDLITSENYARVEQLRKDLRSLCSPKPATGELTNWKEKIEYYLLGMYANLMQFAHSNNQVIGTKNDYYITLEHLERALKFEIDRL